MALDGSLPASSCLIRRARAFSGLECIRPGHPTDTSECGKPLSWVSPAPANCNCGEPWNSVMPRDCPAHGTVYPLVVT